MLLWLRIESGKTKIQKLLRNKNKFGAASELTAPKPRIAILIWIVRSLSVNKTYFHRTHWQWKSVKCNAFIFFIYELSRCIQSDFVLKSSKFKESSVSADFSCCLLSQLYVVCALFANLLIFIIVKSQFSLNKSLNYYLFLI